MSFIKVISLIILFSKVYYSQQLFICKGYTHRGEPIDVISDKKIENKQTVCFLFTYKQNQIDENILFLYVDKINPDKRINLFSTLIRPSKEKQWTVYNYKFQDEGLYEIYITDFNRRKIVSDRISVFNPQRKTTKEISEIQAFPETRVFFCEKIYNEKPIGILSSISLSKTNGVSYIYIVKDKPFSSNRLLVNFWRMKAPNNDYSEFIDSKKFEIKPYWKDTYFKFRFEKTGEYKMNFFNENELLIKTAYIRVND